MQMVLVTGRVLASSPPVRRILAAIAGMARTPGQAILLCTVVSLIAAWINWGFGLVVDALFARQLVRVVPSVDYHLLIASAYSSFIIWHGGISGSVPLTIATPGHFTESLIGVIPTSQTIFSAYNLAIVAALFVAIPLTNVLMMGHGGREVRLDPAELQAEGEIPEKKIVRPADRLENSRVLPWTVGVLGPVFLGLYLVEKGFALNLNIVNFAFLFLGIVLHGSPYRFLTALQEAVAGAAAPGQPARRARARTAGASSTIAAGSGRGHGNSASGRSGRRPSKRNVLSSPWPRTTMGSRGASR
jgi:short-chain fatty acids transporter